MTFHPCCGGSLQTWTKVIAIVQIVRSSLVLIGGIVLLTTGGLITASASLLADVTEEQELQETHDHDLSAAHPHRRLPTNYQEITTVHALSPEDTTAFYSFIGIIIIMASIFFILEGAVNMILSIMLYKGAAERISHKCRIWMIVHCVFFVPGVIFFLVAFTGSETLTSSNAASGCGLILNAYCIWVVYEFIQELRLEEEARRLGMGRPLAPQPPMFEKGMMTKA